MSDEGPRANRKILIIGAILPIDQVCSCRWDNIPQDLNVADFDTLVLDFTPFEIPETAKHIDIDAVPSYRHFARHLFSPASEVIAIGRPFFELGDNPYLDPTWWLPLSPEFLDESGDTILLRDPDFASYFANVGYWSFCLSGWQQIDPYQFSLYMDEAGMPGAVAVRPRVFSIADNRYDRPIAFSFSLRACSEGGGHLGDSGIVTWLPPCTELSSVDAILLLLKERYGILREEQPPVWLATYVLPNELPLLERVEELERKVGSLADQLDKSRERLAEEGRFKKILYETGEEVLEPIVLDVLSELGASIQIPKTKGKEDGRIVDPSGREGTVEIKGRSGPLRIDDVRQAHQWVADRTAYEECPSKGILIANLCKDQHPLARSKVFPDNCVKAAENFCISLVTTTQLFHALMLHQKGDLDLAEFWNAVYEANGICQFPELE